MAAVLVVVSVRNGYDVVAFDVGVVATVVVAFATNVADAYDVVAFDVVVVASGVDVATTDDATYDVAAT